MNENDPRVRVVVVTPAMSKAIRELVENQRRREETIREAEALVLARHLHPEQEKLGTDDNLHYITFAAYESPDPLERVPIFGTIDPPQDSETAHRIAHLHLLKGRTYSIWAVDGLAHDPHAAITWPFDAALFEEAKASEFNPERFSPGLNAHIGVAHLAWLTHREMVRVAEQADIDAFKKALP